MKKLYLIFILGFLFFKIDYAQTETINTWNGYYSKEIKGGRISYSKLVHYLEEIEGMTNDIENVSLIFSEVEFYLEDHFNSNNVRLDWSDTTYFQNKNGELEIKIQPSCSFKNIITSVNLYIENCEVPRLSFDSCEFTALHLKENETYISFTNSIAEKLYCSDKQHYALNLKYSQIQKIYAFSETDLTCTMPLVKFGIAHLASIGKLYLASYGAEADSVYIGLLKLRSASTRCRIIKAEQISIEAYNYFDYKFKNNVSAFELLEITKSDIRSLDLTEVTFKGQLVIDNSIINERLCLTNTKIDALELNATWENFKPGIVNMKLVHLLYSDEGNAIYNDYGEHKKIIKYYNVDDSLAVVKDVYYSELMSLYNDLYNKFKDRGDVKSSNGCYIEMKSFETSRLRLIYQTKGGSSNYLNWQLNVFLKFFADYGTSPIRSLVVSFWVVLAFAIFYFFAETDWDIINRKYLMKQSESILEYFTSEQKLEDFYSKAYKEDLLEYNEFKAKIGESSAKVPFFFMLFLKPLYYMSIIKHKISSWLYRRMEILSGRWVDLSQSKKLMVGSVVAISSVFYVFYLFVLRSLNSIMLSINTFSTLGFGDIPVKGFMRYIAIIEGFLGWFLLSIFSVSLISQILQS